MGIRITGRSLRLPTRPPVTLAAKTSSRSTCRRANNSLSGLAALAPNNVWVAGSFYGTIIEHYNRAKGSMVNTPQGGLAAVAAVSMKSIWAVGVRVGSNRTTTSVEHYNGSKWRAVSSPNAANGQGVLSGVAVISAHNVWAVGDDQSNFIPSHMTLVEHYNGRKWEVVRSPNSR